MAESVAGALSPRAAGKRAMDCEDGTVVRLLASVFREEVL
jgi:hypothetical protein